LMSICKFFTEDKVHNPASIEKVLRLSHGQYRRIPDRIEYGPIFLRIRRDR